MRRLVTLVLWLCLASLFLPGVAFAQTHALFNQLRENSFYSSRTQKHNISAASGNEKLSFLFTSSYSNTAGIVPYTKYEVLNFNFQAMIGAFANIACLPISEQPVLPIKICSLARINYLITKLGPADEG